MELEGAYLGDERAVVRQRAAHLYSTNYLTLSRRATAFIRPVEALALA